LRHDFAKNGSKKLRQTPEEFVLPLCGWRSLKEATLEEEVLWKFCLKATMK